MGSSPAGYCDSATRKRGAHEGTSMTEKFDTHGIYRELVMLGNEAEYEAFLRRQSLAGDHSFLLASISRSNLNPAVRKVLEELVRFGKIRRPKHRPKRPSPDTDLIGLRRALCVLDIVLDIEAAGC